MKTCTVNDIDGTTCHTVHDGPLEDVLSRADDRLAAQIRRAMDDPTGVAQETFARDGEQFTTRVIVR
jgi:hypothetical protein